MGEVIKLEAAKLADEIDIPGMRSDDLKKAIEIALNVIEASYQDEDLVDLVNSLLCWAESEAFANGLTEANRIFHDETNKEIARRRDNR